MQLSCQALNTLSEAQAPAEMLFSALKALALSTESRFNVQTKGSISCTKKTVVVSNYLLKVFVWLDWFGSIDGEI